MKVDLSKPPVQHSTMSCDDNPYQCVQLWLKVEFLSILLLCFMSSPSVFVRLKFEESASLKRHALRLRWSVVGSLYCVEYICYYNFLTVTDLHSYI